MPMASWRIVLRPNERLFQNVTYVIVIVDSDFPVSDPRVIAPDAPQDFQWPHVEPGGVLCLKPLTRSVSAGNRVIQAYNDAVELGAYSEATRESEFRREVRTYWERRITAGSPVFVSLVDPVGDSGEVWYFRNLNRSRYIFADDKTTLRSWLLNRGENPSDRQLRRTLLAKTASTPTPSEFPEKGRDILNAGVEKSLAPYLVPGEDLPLLIKTVTEGVPVFLGVLLRSAPASSLQKGFRSLARVPEKLVLDSFAARPLVRCRVERADGKWVHGRDHDPDYASSQAKRLVIVGCGAIGGSLARTLVQAGVGNITLIDTDTLQMANTSRHVLGQDYVGMNKAEALAQKLSREFPHITVTSLSKACVQNLSPKDIDQIKRADLIVSAGIDLVGDAAIDRLRSSLDLAPNWVCTWAEEFALAGHAVAILGKMRLLEYFTEEGYPSFAATTWPTGVTTRMEAGCGNSFQPHGAIDLAEVISLAARLSLDLLLGRVTKPCRRVWLGDMSRVANLGGTVSEWIQESNVVKEFAL